MALSVFSGKEMSQLTDCWTGSQTEREKLFTEEPDSPLWVFRKTNSPRQMRRIAAKKKPERFLRKNLSMKSQNQSSVVGRQAKTDS
jgi:hypothetical protein